MTAAHSHVLLSAILGHAGQHAFRSQHNDVDDNFL